MHPIKDFFLSPPSQWVVMHLLAPKEQILVLVFVQNLKREVLKAGEYAGVVLGAYK